MFVVLVPVLSSFGPMARDVDSLALCMQALLCDHMFRLDPTVPPIPFNQQVGSLSVIGSRVMLPLDADLESLFIFFIFWGGGGL